MGTEKRRPHKLASGSSAVAQAVPLILLRQKQTRGQHPNVVNLKSYYGQSQNK